MKTTIRVLKEEDINRIKAGEVIEDSASVVKELVENSIDAGATLIHIETKGGGRAEIKVSDNGCGMGSDDLLLCLERHATSKIRSSDDLFSLKTMGFRGEAIPSIASCSKMRILSCASEGCEIYQEGGKIYKLQPAFRTQGTTVEVHSLFYNVPVRKKFAKSPAMETNGIAKIITLQALAHREMGFCWSHEGEEKIALPPGEDKDTHLIKLLGKEFYEQLIPIYHEEDGLELDGYIGTSASHRPKRNGQYLFINSRPIYSPFIASIVKESYGSSLPENRHPVFLLYLTLPADKVDVNVHPQKKEVRFCEEEKIRKFLHKALQKKRAPPLVFEINASENESSNWIVTPPLFSSAKVPLSEEQMLPLIVKPSILAIIGEYIFAEIEQTFAFIHARKASQKIALHTTESFLEKGLQPPSQALLLPFMVDCPKQNFPLVLQELPLLQSLGIGIEHFGGESFKIDALPPHMSIEDIEAMMRDIAEDLCMGKEKKNKVMHRIASYGFQKSMTKESAAYLVERLFKLENPYFGEGGECIIKKLDEKELEIWMKRAV